MAILFEWDHMDSYIAGPLHNVCVMVFTVLIVLSMD